MSDSNWWQINLRLITIATLHARDTCTCRWSYISNCLEDLCLIKINKRGSRYWIKVDTYFEIRHCLRAGFLPQLASPCIPSHIRPQLQPSNRKYMTETRKQLYENWIQWHLIYKIMNSIVINYKIAYFKLPLLDNIHG